MHCKNCGNKLGGDYCLTCGFQAGRGHKHCPNCGQAITEGADLCLSCGKLIHTHVAKKGAIVCDDCHTAVNFGAHFCPGCGKNVLDQENNCPTCGKKMKSSADVCLSCGRIAGSLGRPARPGSAPVAKVAKAPKAAAVASANDGVNEDNKKLKRLGKILAICGSALTLIALVIKIFAFALAARISSEIFQGNYYDYEDFMLYNANYEGMVNFVDSIFPRLIFIVGIVALIGAVIVFVFAHKNKNKLINILRYSIIPGLVGINLILFLVSAFVPIQALFVMLIIFGIITCLVIGCDIVFRAIVVKMNIGRLVISGIALLLIMIYGTSYVMSLVNSFSLHEVALDAGAVLPFTLYGHCVEFIAANEFVVLSSTASELSMMARAGFHYQSVVSGITQLVLLIQLVVASLLSGLLFTKTKTE